MNERPDGQNNPEPTVGGVHRLSREKSMMGKDFFFDGIMVSDLQRSGTPNGPRVFFQLELEVGVNQTAEHRVWVDKPILRDYVSEEAEKGKRVTLWGTFLRKKISHYRGREWELVIKASQIRFG